MENMINQCTVIGTIESKVAGKVQLFEIGWMSDDRWQQLARENAMKNYERENGRPPENAEQAVAWQRNWINSMAIS